MPSAVADSQAGLEWKEAWFGDVEPAWTVEPDTNVIAKIARCELGIPGDVVCEIKFLASGAFNKVYTIKCGDNIEHVIRVSLPVQPHFKTMSETATITYVRHHTDIPAPKVSASDLSNKNELGFEWMIEDFVPGRNLLDAWKTMSWLKKELLVRKIISYFVQLFGKRFDRLGNLYSTKDLQKFPTADLSDVKLLGAEHTTNTDGFCQSHIVSMPFFWGKHVSCDVARGPFTNSRDWLATQLQLHLIDLEDEPESDSDSDNEPDPDNSEEAVKRRADRLLALISQLFPEDEQEQFVLHHNDLNQGNILVDSNDELSGVLDWECVHTVPLWYACQMPKFLDAELDRSVCPDPDKFTHETLEDGTVKLNDMYVRHLEEYENQCLWEFFLKEMSRQCPEWIKWYYQGKLKAGLEDCVATFGMPMSSRDIDSWLDNMENKGYSRSLLEIRRVAQHYLNDPYGYRSPNSDDDWESASESESE